VRRVPYCSQMGVNRPGAEYMRVAMVAVLRVAVAMPLSGTRSVTVVKSCVARSYTRASAYQLIVSGMAVPAGRTSAHPPYADVTSRRQL
jgi:hypothetical protein